MQKMMILIISIIIIAVAGAIYYFNYTKKSPSEVGCFPPYCITDPNSPKNSDQEWQSEICKNLSRDECENNDNCAGQYGSSYCSPEGGCTMDMAFLSCSPSGLNPNEIEQIKTECNKIKGEFKRGDFGLACYCTNPSYTNSDGLCINELVLQLKQN